MVTNFTIYDPSQPPALSTAFNVTLNYRFPQKSGIACLNIIVDTKQLTEGTETNLFPIFIAHVRFADICETQEVKPIKQR